MKRECLLYFFCMLTSIGACSACQERSETYLSAFRDYGSIDTCLLEPQSIGKYDTNPVYKAFVEGMENALRIAEGELTPADRPKGGNYMDGGRTAGYFFIWLCESKDPDFLRKFNRSTLKVVPWSFDGAIRQILGKKFGIDDLWREYQEMVGDAYKCEIIHVQPVSEDNNLNAN